MNADRIKACEEMIDIYSAEYHSWKAEYNTLLDDTSYHERAYIDNEVGLAEQSLIHWRNELAKAQAVPVIASRKANEGHEAIATCEPKGKLMNSLMENLDRMYEASDHYYDTWKDSDEYAKAVMQNSKRRDRNTRIARRRERVQEHIDIARDWLDEHDIGHYSWQTHINHLEKWIAELAELDSLER